MDCYSIPHMEDLFSELAGATHYSQTDLSSMYCQPPLHPESYTLSAFKTHEGLFQFTCVPFCLTSAPSTFQKMMYTVLKALFGVQNYLDDINVYDKSKESHDKHLQAVLQHFKDAGLQINFDKSSFFQTHIPYLGHVVSKDGPCRSSNHLTDITECPTPKEKAALHSVLSLQSWFNKFLPNCPIS